MRPACFILMLFALTGCAGALGGGSSYRVEWTEPDGTHVRATADSAEKTNQIEFILSRNDKGEPTITLNKKSEAGTWSNPMLEKNAETANTAVKALATMVGAK